MTHGVSRNLLWLLHVHLRLYFYLPGTYFLFCPDAFDISECWSTCIHTSTITTSHWKPRHLSHLVSSCFSNYFLTRAKFSYSLYMYTKVRPTVNLAGETPFWIERLGLLQGHWELLNKSYIYTVARFFALTALNVIYSMLYRFISTNGFYTKGFFNFLSFKRVLYFWIALSSIDMLSNTKINDLVVLDEAFFKMLWIWTSIIHHPALRQAFSWMLKKVLVWFFSKKAVLNQNIWINLTLGSILIRFSAENPFNGLLLTRYVLDLLGFLLTITGWLLLFTLFSNTSDWSSSLSRLLLLKIKFFKAQRRS